MASYAWTNGAAHDGNQNWDTVTNWSPEAPAGGPVAGDTLTFDAGEGADGSKLPDTGPGVAGAFTVSISGYTATKNLSDFLPTALCTATITSLTDATLNLTFDLGCTLPAAVSLNAVTFNTTGTVVCVASPGTTITAAGAVTGTAIGTLTNPLNLTLVGTANLSWNLLAKPLTLLTANGTTTLNGTVITKALAGTGDIAIGTQFLFLYLSGTDFWTYTGAMTSGAGNLRLMAGSTASLTNAASINAGSATVIINPKINDATLAVTGDFKTTGALYLRSETAGKRCTLQMTGDFQAGAITLGEVTYNSLGTITLPSAGSHVFTSLVKAGTGTSHVFAFGGGTSAVSGNIALTGIAATSAGATVACAGTFTVGTGGSLTVNADGFTLTGATLSVTGNGALICSDTLTVPALTLNTTGSVTLPAAVATGDFTVTNVGGTLTCNAAGTTVTVAGNVIGTAITTLTNPLKITMAGTGKTIAWPLPTAALARFTITGTASISGTDLVVKAIAGSGTLTVPDGAELDIYAYADDFWTLTTALAGPTSTAPGLGVALALGANVSNSAAINAGSVRFCPNCGVTRTLKLPGGVTAGSLTLEHVGGAGGVVDMDGGNLVCGAIENNGGGVHFGTLLLGEGTHSFSSISNAGASVGTLNFESSRCTVSGNMTLANIAADFGSARIESGGAITIDGASATSITNNRGAILGLGGTVTLQNFDTNWASGAPPIQARRFSAGTGGNGARLVTYAPYWMPGLPRAA